MVSLEYIPNEKWDFQRNTLKIEEAGISEAFIFYAKLQYILNNIVWHRESSWEIPGM